MIAYGPRFHPQVPLQKAHHHTLPLCCSYPAIIKQLIVLQNQGTAVSRKP